MRLPYSKIIFLPSIGSSSIIKCTRLHRWVSVGQGIIVWGKCQGLSWKYTRPLISLLSSQCTNKGKKVEGYLVSSFREKKGEVSITGYVEQMELERKINFSFVSISAQILTIKVVVGSGVLKFSLSYSLCWRHGFSSGWIR